jgi:hypothetical protein
MRRLFSSRLLLLALTLLFATGYGHQVFWKYVPHHHAEEQDAGQPAHEEHESPAKHEGDCLGHHSVSAVVCEFTLPLVGHLIATGRLTVFGDTMPEAPTAGIDVPPQRA